jgi:hypothetical protein
MTATPNKTVVDNRLPAPGRNDPPDYNRALKRGLAEYCHI